jgi:hypothetical protein
VRKRSLQRLRNSNFRDSYCKPCIEAGKVTVAREFVPSGFPSKTPFITGAVGTMLSGVAAVVFVALVFLIQPYVYNLPAMISFIIVGAGLVVNSFGYKGMKTNFGLKMGTASFALGIVGSVLTMITAGFGAALQISHYNYSFLNQVFIVLLFITLVFLGVMQIVWGVAQIIARRFAGSSALALATGILLVISGAITASLIVFYAGLVLFLVSEILTFVVFITFKIRKQNKA